MKPAVISFKNISKSFDDLIVVDNFSIDVYPGEFLTLLGPSGCGKTSVLRLIAGFEEADHGEIFIDGISVSGKPPNQRNVNTVFQSYALFPHMTVFDNIAFGLKIKKHDWKHISQEVLSALEMVKLTGMGDRKIHRLSGGQQQRVAIARAIVNKPLVLLLDESLSALDYRLRKEMQLELKHLQRKLGITFIFVTHDQEEAITMSDRIVVMNNGRIEQDGSPKEVYEEPVNLFVARFVGEINVFDGEVISTGKSRMIARVGGTDFELANKKGFEVGQKIRVLLRPEDIKVERPAEGCSTAPFLEGKVREMIYKGTTVDLIVNLNREKTILITEFFNEDAEDIHYESGEKVCISWIKGWEVILTDD
ncbi:MAG: spermidine/putrescine ABC transporter ATP-binding protein PotA [Deltaproteobacteria bacterium]|nr:MAG: spermidine/putrescine ABC transporter ATP-binding protein PotA [Deltaproteobacteria bacterium]